jgi:hypothetical protein
MRQLKLLNLGVGKSGWSSSSSPVISGLLLCLHIQSCKTVKELGSGSLLVADYITGSSKGKSFGVASLHAGQFILLDIQNHIFAPFVYMVKSSRLTHSLFNETLRSSTPYLSLWSPESKPVIQDIQLQRCGIRSPGEPRPAPVLGHAFHHRLKLNSWAKKSKHFLSEVGWQSFKMFTVPVLLFVWWIINLISFSSRALFVIFVNCHWG